MKLSIIVPAYNSADHLSACLESLSNQNNWKINKDYEIVLVDDGSTDQTQQVARQFSVRLVSLPKNQGRIAARQAGAKQAKAKQLLFVDSRVEVASDFLKTLSKYLKKHRCILAGGYQVSSHPLHWSRFFTLIRQKWYGERFWPTPKRSHWIVAQNFIRSPKGMGVFSLPKSLFWLIQPKDHSRWQNDDTKLLESLVIDRHIPILRVAQLKWSYSFRNNWLETLVWLTNRGTYFASYYLQPGHRLFLPLVSLLIILLLISALAIWKIGFIGFIGISLMLLLALVAILAKRPADLLAIWIHFPIMILFFAFGEIRYWWLQLLTYRQANWFRASLSGAIIFIFLLVIYQNRQSLFLLTSFSWQSTLSLIIIYSVFLAMNGLFLRQILRAFKIDLPILNAIGVSSLSTIGNTLLPARGGAAWRASYLHSRFSLSLTDFLATLTAGYFITFNVNALISMIALSFLGLQGNNFPANLFFLFFTIWTLTGLSMLFPHFWLDKKQVLPAKIHRGLSGWLKLMKNRQVLFQLIAISLINVFLSAILLWREYQTLNLPSISLVETTILSSTASLGLFISLTPAALGIREGLLMISAKLINVEPAQALAVGLLDRAISLVSLLLLIWPSIWLVQRSFKNSSKQL